MWPRLMLYSTIAAPSGCERSLTKPRSIFNSVTGNDRNTAREE